MDNRCLVVLEVSQKQNYIFRADELKHNVGASMIVRYVTEEIGNKFCKPEEFFFAGGGKSDYIFNSKEEAVKFISCVSKMVLVKYPGIELFAGLAEYGENEKLPDVMNRAYQSLNEKKSLRKESYRLIGLGMSVNSIDSNLPVSYEGRKDNLTLEAWVKGNVAEGDAQMDYFRDLLPDEEKYRFPLEFDQLGVTKGTKSYLAVIVMDGNRMGKKFERFGEIFKKKYDQARDDAEIEEINEEYRKSYRELSDKVDEIYKKAVKIVNQKVASVLDQLTEKGIVSFRTDKNKEYRYLPIRPLVVAGDDICIVTDARIGLSYAKLLLEEIERQSALAGSIAGIELNMKACAGVAMVKSHYPCFRSHELAEDLCHNAKKKIPAPSEEDMAGDNGNASVMDFHIVQGEIEGTLNEIRAEKYDNGDLTAKPYFISGENVSKLTEWKMFKDRLGLIEKKKYSRSTLKEFREALIDGTEAMKTFKRHHRMDRRQDDWWDDRGINFDAIEVMDLYNNLEAYL